VAAGAGVPPPPPQRQPAAVSTPGRLDKALGEEWSFCADNLAATTVQAWLISLPSFLIIIFYNEKIGNAVGNLLGIIATWEPSGSSSSPRRSAKSRASRAASSRDFSILGVGS
jgi:hypothetical protein